jgi:hypothetical protein
VLGLKVQTTPSVETSQNVQEPCSVGEFNAEVSADKPQDHQLETPDVGDQEEKSEGVKRRSRVKNAQILVLLWHRVRRQVKVALH